jgi:SpoIID/LytB domain protein
VPLPAGVHAQVMSRAATAKLRPLIIVAAAVTMFASVGASQTTITDQELRTAGGGRAVRVGSTTGTRSTTLPLEVYVARVLAGEGEPQAADAARQALAIAIRTYALANAGRHRDRGFDLCDSTHCQVMRAATPATRLAAWLTAGRVLTYNGRPAELFYSASCGGYSESASEVWPDADYPYLKAARDDVHADDEPWAVEFSLSEVHQALRRIGFEGRRLTAVEVQRRSSSGRVTQLRLAGLQPDVVTGDQFRLAVGARELRSTAFQLEAQGSRLRFTGRGYGHGVGMCVIGAGRRAMRGESAEAILAQYFPGLALSGAAGMLGPAAEPVRIATSPALDTIAARAHASLAKALGTSIAPITLELHESIESFRRATGRPWWVSVVASGTSIDLAPAAVLEQREGVDGAIRRGVAELLVAGPLAGRPAWVRVGAARYFARTAPHETPPTVPRCPSDAELTSAISAAGYRDAEVRAETCFAAALRRTGDWRTVR